MVFYRLNFNASENQNEFLNRLYKIINMNPIYTTTVIYLIICKDLAINEQYVGSTTNFKIREKRHKSNCKCGIKYRLYDFIRNNGGWSNFVMFEIEKFPCNTLVELKMREKHWMNILDCKLNTISPYTSLDEHKENKNEYNNIKNNCDCGGCYCYKHRARHNATKKHCMYLQTTAL